MSELSRATHLNLALAKKRVAVLFVPVMILGIETIFVKPWPVFGDASFYAAMAKDPFVFMTPQGYTGNAYGYRILTPLIVHALPLSADSGFWIVTIVSLLLSAVVLYLFLTQCFSLSHRMGILGQFLFLTDITIVYNVGNLRLVDPLAYLFLILGLYFAYSQMSVLFAITFPLGVVNKEIELILAPLYYLINNDRKLDLACLRKTVLLCAPGIVCFWALHVLISGRIEEPSSSTATITANLAYSWLSRPVQSTGWLVFSWSLLWALAFLGYARYCHEDRARRLVWLMPFVFALAIVYDVSRMLAYGFPAMIAYSLCTVGAWSKSRRGLLATVLVIATQTILQVALLVFVLHWVG